MGRQRGAILLALVAVIGGGGFRAWRGYQAMQAERAEGAAVSVDARGKPNYGLPVPEGAHVVLPPGAIPAINRPRFVPAASAKASPDSPMILVTHNGETHVYSMYLLDGHEIVNDTFGGDPVATTW